MSASKEWEPQAPGLLLAPEDRERIKVEADGAERQNRRRVAHILLLYDEGAPTREAAAVVGLSQGRVRYWRRQYRIQGMELFTSVRQPKGKSAKEPWVTNMERAETGEEPGIISLEQTSSDYHPPAIVLEPAAKSNKQAARDQRTASGDSAGQAPIPPAREAPQSDEMLALAKTLKAPGVEADDLLAEAARKVLRYHFLQMVKNEAGTRLGEDIEALHDMRVATRRMRAAFDIFGSTFKEKTLRRYLKGLRATGRALGRVRDLDVSLEKAAHYLAPQPEGNGPTRDPRGLEPLLETWRQGREAARAQMLTHLNSPEYESFKKDFYRFLNTSGMGVSKKGAVPLIQGEKVDSSIPGAEGGFTVRQIAPALMYARLAEVRAFERRLDNATMEELHALRIEFKKFRYTVEFFREVLGGEAKEVIEVLKGLQDHLGDLNDAQVATLMLQDFLASWDARQMGRPLDTLQSMEGVAAYLAFRHAERYLLRRSFPDAWARFSRQDFLRNMALAISVL